MDKTETFKESNSIEEFVMKSSIGPVFWPDKTLDGDPIYDTDSPEYKDRITTINDTYIPNEISTDSRISYSERLNPEKKDIAPSIGMYVDPTDPRSKRVYSLKDRK